MAKSNRRLDKSLKKFSNQKEERLVTISGELGLPLGGQKLVEVPNRKGFVYVRLRNNTSEVIQAYNSEVSTIYGLSVLVARQNNIYKVIGRDQDRYKDWGNIPYLPKHGGQHSFNQAIGMGADITWVYPQQIMPLLGYPSGTNGSNGIIVAPYLLRDLNGGWKYAGNTGTPDITMYRPTTATGAIMVLVYIDTVSGNPYLLVGSGTMFHAGLTGTSQIAPYIPQSPNPNWIPDTAVRLTTGTTTLLWGNLYDVRPFLQPIPTGSGGGGGSISTGTLDARYLKLDTSNDPLTGLLDIIPSTIDTKGLNIETMGDAASFSVSQRATGSVGVSSSVFTLQRESSGDSSPTFNEPIMYLSQSRNASGTMVGGLLRYDSDSIERVRINPNVQGTGTLAFLDGDYTLSPDGLLLLLKNHGVPRFYVNASGTAYSNGVPLIKEAPVDGNQYARKNAGWEQVTSSGGGGSGTFLITEDLTSQINGAVTTFSLSNIPNPLTSARLYYNGVRQRYLFNYTISGSYIQTLYTPTTGSVLTVDYNEGSTTGTLNGLIQVQDEGAVQGNVNTLNFVGAGVQATVSGQSATILITGSSTQNYFKQAESGTVVAVSGTTNEITLYSGTFNGGLLGTNGLIALDSLVEVNHAVVGTVTLKLYYGSQSVSMAIAQGASAALKPGRISFRIGAKGLTNSQFVEGQAHLIDGTTFFFKEANGFLTVDSTINQRFQLTAQWGGSNNGLAYIQHHLNIGYYP